jgi:hypothetical protein
MAARNWQEMATVTAERALQVVELVRFVASAKAPIGRVAWVRHALRSVDSLRADLEELLVALVHEGQARPSAALEDRRAV